MHWLTAPGTSHPEERRIVTGARRELRTIPRGRPLRTAHRAGVPRRGGRRVQLRRELGQRRPQPDYDKTLARIQETVDAHPGRYHDVQTYRRERLDEVLAGAAEPIVVRIFGADLKTLRSGPTASGTRSRTSTGS
jgi:Cu/Ag efflux pump CusA